MADYNESSTNLPHGSSRLAMMKDRISASAASMIKNLELLGLSSVSSAAVVQQQQQQQQQQQADATTTTEAQSSSLEQALRHLFTSCTTGASGTVAAATDYPEMAEPHPDDEDDDEEESSRSKPLATEHPVWLIPREETSSSSPSSHRYPTRRTTSAAAVISLRNLDAMRSSSNDSRAAATPSQQQQQQQHEDTTTNKPSFLKRQQHVFQPLLISTPLRGRPLQPQQVFKTTPTQDLGNHIYEHLLLEQEKEEEQEEDVAADQQREDRGTVGRMGIAPVTPRLFPASSPGPPTESNDMHHHQKFLMIHAVPSEDEISAISAHTLEAMAQLDRTSSRDSGKATTVPKALSNNNNSKPQPTIVVTAEKQTQSPHDTTFSNYDSSFDDSQQQPAACYKNGRYGTPHSRSTTEDSSSHSFDKWQDVERQYWKSQQSDMAQKIQQRQQRSSRRHRKARGDATLSTESSTRHNDYQHQQHHHQHAYYYASSAAHPNSELAEI